MNVNFRKEDLRIIKTQSSLLKALGTLLQHQSFKQVTVNDLCSEAIISRAAFYTHFKDKYDLLKFYFDNLIVDEFAVENTNKFVNDIILNQNKALSHIILDADNETIEIVQGFLFSAINAALEKGPYEIGTNEYAIFSNFCAGGLYQVLFWQNQNKFPAYIKNTGEFFDKFITKLMSAE